MEKQKRIVYFLRVIFTILIVVTCIIIFSFSSQNGEESGGISSNLAKQIATVFNIDESNNQELIKQIEIVIRKIAHFSIYTILGIWLMCLMQTFFNNKEWKYDTRIKWRLTISGLLGFIYACSDEIHQSLIPGRTMKGTDIFLDTLGILCGVIIIAIIDYIRKGIQKRSKT